MGLGLEGVPVGGLTLAVADVASQVLAVGLLEEGPAGVLVGGQVEGRVLDLGVCPTLNGVVAPWDLLVVAP